MTVLNNNEASLPLLLYLQETIRNALMSLVRRVLNIDEVQPSELGNFQEFSESRKPEYNDEKYRRFYKIKRHIKKIQKISKRQSKDTNQNTAKFNGRPNMSLLMLEQTSMPDYQKAFDKILQIYNHFEELLKMKNNLDLDHECAIEIEDVENLATTSFLTEEDDRNDDQNSVKKNSEQNEINSNSEALYQQKQMKSSSDDSKEKSQHQLDKPSTHNDTKGKATIALNRTAYQEMKNINHEELENKKKTKHEIKYKLVHNIPKIVPKTAKNLEEIYNIKTVNSAVVDIGNVIENNDTLVETFQEEPAPYNNHSYESTLRIQHEKADKDKPKLTILKVDGLTNYVNLVHKAKLREKTKTILLNKEMDLLREVFQQEFTRYRREKIQICVHNVFQGQQQQQQQNTGEELKKSFKQKKHSFFKMCLKSQKTVEVEEEHYSCLSSSLSESL